LFLHLDRPRRTIIPELSLARFYSEDSVGTSGVLISTILAATIPSTGVGPSGTCDPWYHVWVVFNPDGGYEVLEV